MVETTFKEYKKVLTDPNAHKSENFVYVVHGLRSFDNLEEKLSKIKNKGEFYSASLVGILNKEIVNEKFGGCMAISQVDTYMPVGFILDFSEVPDENEIIKVAWNCDLGAPTDKEESKKYVRQHEGKARYPFALLAQTAGEHPVRYNEILIEGDEKTKITGIFYRNVNDNIKREAKLLQQKVHDELKMDLPLVELPFIRECEEPHLDAETKELAEVAKRMTANAKRNEVLREFYNPGLSTRGGSSMILSAFIYSPELRRSDVSSRQCQ